MANLVSFQAILFPSDDRNPHLVSLATSPVNTHGVPAVAEPFRCGRMPHPEVFMDYIAEGLGAQSWAYKVVDILDGMTKKFPTPYIIFYPTVSRDGMAFPVNKFIREVQGREFLEAKAWRGNVVVAKYRDLDYSDMTNASMADFPIVKNWLQTHRTD
ncbi:hypothetical protein PsYK624_008370 [Phanerochaete sordida]|uniref:Uncharacterized protein n=1 Tax=Phanerochaete sordida TaxID=48140 RepID=A0A9P3L775_9APHY|nr:hypothetical protein PsYK624_008370 [Phanerochaete sordida]